ncbi:MAG: prenyltransferase [Pseudomonadota bacterium]
MMDGLVPISLPRSLSGLEPAIDRILKVQKADGAIPWFEQGAWDPWNHTESAMALMAAGEVSAAAAAFDYLAASQQSDGSWLGEYGNALPMVDRDHISRTQAPVVKDTNFAAYPGVGIYHRFLVDGDEGEAAKFWPMIEAAMRFVGRLQTEAGDISWSAEAPGGPDDDALLAGNASIAKSLACAIALGEAIDKPVDHLRQIRDRLVHALRYKPDRFDRRGGGQRYAMDWYYPILAGVLPPAQAKQRFDADWARFVVDGLGCRCVDDEPWVTVAETAELVMAALCIGEREKAERLFETINPVRDEAGVYWMGWQFEESLFWPLEQPSWTQAAVILAADALWGKSAASQLLVSNAL